MRRALPPVLVLLAAGLLAWWLLLAQDAGNDPDPAPLPEAGAPQHGAVLHGAAPADPGPSAANRPPGAAVQAAQDAAQTAPVRWSGNLTVAGASGPVRFDPPVRLVLFEHQPRISSQEGFPPIDLELHATGPFAFDVTAALGELAARSARGGVELHADHPAYLALRRRLPLPVARDVLAGKAVLPPLDLVLYRAGRVEGIILGPAGEPQYEAHVLLYAMTREGPQREPIDETSTAEDGRFALRFGDPGRYLLVGTWRRYDEQLTKLVDCPLPAHVVLDLDPSAAVDPQTLRLQASLTVRGRVLRGGRPQAGATVTWRLAEEGRRLSVWRDSEFSDSWGLVHARGSVHWGWDDVSTRDDGTFIIRGLSALPCRLRLESLPQALIHRMATADVEQVVTPPRDDVVFDAPLATLSVTTRIAGRPVAAVQVAVAALGMHPDLPPGVTWDTRAAVTDVNGLVEVDLSPRHTYFLAVRDEAFEPFHEPFTAPEAGGVRRVVIDLVPARAKPRLLVTLAGEGAAEVALAGFAFYPLEVPATQRSPNRIVNVGRDEDGRFVVEGLEPGRRRLHVRPGRSWHGVAGTWLEATAEVELPAAGEAAVRVPITRGGQLHLGVTDAHGRHLEAACMLRDEGGVAIPAWFRTEGELGGSILSQATLTGAGPCWVEPVLEAGAYDLAIALDGYEPAHRRVAVVAGRPTVLYVVLEPAR